MHHQTRSSLDEEVNNFIVRYAHYKLPGEPLKLIRTLYERNKALTNELNQLQENQKKRKYTECVSESLYMSREKRQKRCAEPKEYTLEIDNYNNTNDSTGDDCGSGEEFHINGSGNVTPWDPSKRGFYEGIKKSLLKLANPARKQYTEKEINRQFHALHEIYLRDPCQFKKRYASQVAPVRSLKYHVFKEMKAYLKSSNDRLIATVSSSDSIEVASSLLRC